MPECDTEGACTTGVEFASRRLYRFYTQIKRNKYENPEDMPQFHRAGIKKVSDVSDPAANILSLGSRNLTSSPCR